VSDGTRTRDRLDHNQELYLLSYAHHASALSGDVRNLAVGSGLAEGEPARGAAAGGAGAVHGDLERHVGAAGARELCAGGA
jgi:hypothetical protein